LLGSDMSRARLREAINVLGGVGKKQAKKLEKEYAQLAGDAQTEAGTDD
jgi:glutamyl-tRNA synthetase